MGADVLAKQSSSEARPTSKDLEIEVQRCPSIDEVHNFTIQSESSWMTPILSFLQDGKLPQDVEEERKVKKRAVRFTILNDTLYKKGFSMPYLRCVNKEEAKYILKEIHEGNCKERASSKSLISKVIRMGYFWPTLQKDAKEFVKKCDKWQRFGNIQRIPFKKLKTISSLWLFTQ